MADAIVAEDADIAEDASAVDDGSVSERAAAAAPGRDTGSGVLRLSRGAVPELRRIFGSVLGEDGGVGGATIAVEGTGQRQAVGEDGTFDLAVAPTGRVGVLTVAGSADTLYFDLTGGSRYVIEWPHRPRASLRPGIPGDPYAADVVPLPAPAPRNPAFEAYLNAREAPLPAPVELQFAVNGRGRPTGIRLGPTYDVSQRDFRRAREVLQAGPDWGERWRRGRWRYVIR